MLLGVKEATTLQETSFQGRDVCFGCKDEEHRKNEDENYISKSSLHLGPLTVPHIQENLPYREEERNKKFAFIGGPEPDRPCDKPDRCPDRIVQDFEKPLRLTIFARDAYLEVHKCDCE